MLNKKSIMNTRSMYSLLFLSTAMSAIAQTATVERGPYLQILTDDSVTVKWQTDVNSNSRVYYGTSPGSLTEVAVDSNNGTDHEVEITGLSANTRYYYAVQAGSGQSTDAHHTFKTAPFPGTVQALRIWAIGDSGTADQNARNVRNAFKNYGDGDADVWLMLGDNAYNSGTDSEFQAAVFDTYPDLLKKIPLWPTLGNHDGFSADSATLSGPYYDIFTLPRNGEAGGVPSGTEAYYSFDYANVHFVNLDSYDSSRSASGAMAQWLEQDLAATDQDWIIAFWHHPPYTKGSHNSDTETAHIQMRQNLLPILEEYGVDLVLGGHSHSYERSYLLDGHYGSSSTLNSSMILDSGDGRPTGNGAYQKDFIANDGAVYVVAGSSGKTSSMQGTHPAMFVSLRRLGSMVVDIDDNRLDAVFLRENGAIDDSFTIIKGEGTGGGGQLPGVAGAPSPANGAGNQSVNTVVSWSAGNGADSHNVYFGTDPNPSFVQNQTASTYNPGSLNYSNTYYWRIDEVNAEGTTQGNVWSFTTEAQGGGGGGQPITVDLNAVADAYVSSNNAGSNYGSASDLLVDGDDPYGSGNDKYSLIRWDLSGIPSNASVSSVSLSVQVTNATSNNYPIRVWESSWTEGGITWNNSVGGGNNGTQVGTATGNTGSRTFTLNAAGVSMVQGWISGSLPNHGVVIGDSSSSNGLDFDSKEGGMAPKLSVTYTVQ